MAAPVANDRKKAANVRRLLLSEIERIFTIPKEEITEEEKTLKRDLLLKMAPNTLPRIHEGSGEGGEIVVKQITGTVIQSDDSDIQDQDSTAN